MLTVPRNPTQIDQTAMQLTNSSCIFFLDKEKKLDRYDIPDNKRKMHNDYCYPVSTLFPFNLQTIVSNKQKKYPTNKVNTKENCKQR